MIELSLNEIKQVELEILKFFKSYCEENGLKYFLSNGTLLGAIKYKGFIPWDDDIDVLLPREHYNKFIADFPQKGNLKLLCSERDKNYLFPFAKLSDPSTLIQQQTRLKGYEYGIHIDIFPLDYWNDDLFLSRQNAKRISAIGRNMGFAIAIPSKGRTFLRTCVKNILISFSHLRGYSYYHCKLLNEIEKCLKNAGTDNCGCVVWPVYEEREIIPVEVFQDSIEVVFESEVFSAPIGYDIYLRSLYGDYRKDPPIEKQQSHHRYVAYRR